MASDEKRVGRFAGLKVKRFGGQKRLAKISTQTRFSELRRGHTRPEYQSYIFGEIAEAETAHGYYNELKWESRFKLLSQIATMSLILDGL